MDILSTVKIFDGLIGMTKSRKGTAFIVAVIIILVGRIYGDMDIETTLTIATLAFGYIGGQSIVDSKQAVIEIGEVIEDIVTGDAQDTTV